MTRNGGWVEDGDNQLQHCFVGYVFRIILNIVLSRVGLYATRINVDSSDLTREFI
jgi:hypothetical protein